MPGLYETLAELEAAKRRSRLRELGYQDVPAARQEVGPVPPTLGQQAAGVVAPVFEAVRDWGRANREDYSGSPWYMMPFTATADAPGAFAEYVLGGPAQSLREYSEGAPLAEYEPTMRGGQANPLNYRLNARAADVLDAATMVGGAANALPRAVRNVPDFMEGLIDLNRRMADDPMMGLGSKVIGKPYRDWKYGDELEGFVNAPDVTDAAMAGKAMTDADLAGLRGQLLEAGHPPEWVDSAMTRIRTGSSVVPEDVATVNPAGGMSDLDINKTVNDIIMRIGVLNTPAVEGLRFNRVRAVIDAIEEGKAYVEVPGLDGGPPRRIDIPKDMRGRKVHEFYNLPSTDPVLRRPKPESFNYPVVVTGNPHLKNFVRPHPSWDGVISTVRIKPTLKTNEQTAQAVADSINYAHEIGAKPLVTTFRSKSLWTLAKYTDVVPVNPKHPDFDRYWYRNPEPPPEDVRRRPHYQPYLPKDVTRKEFRAAGWDSGQSIYGHGGTWWWPRGKELEDRVLLKVNDKDGPIEFCDLMGKGCTSCRNCQKTTHPDAATARVMGCTDEPFCNMACPGCFVANSQSGVKGRGSISIKPNAKQAGFGEPDLGDKYSGSINILQGVARRQDAPANYVSKFLAQPTASNAGTMGIVPAPPPSKNVPGQPGWEQYWGFGQKTDEKGRPAVTKTGAPQMGYLPKQAAETAYQRERMDMALSLLADGRITPEQFAVLRREIMSQAR